MAERVWNINTGTEEEKALSAINGIENFYHSLGIKTRLSEYVENYKDTANTIAHRLNERGITGLGEHKEISPDDVRKIVEMSY